MRFSRSSIAIVLLSSSVNAIEPITKQRTLLKKYVADQLLRQQQTNDRSLASLDDRVYNDMPSNDSTACQQCDSVMKSYIPKVDHRMMASKQDDDNIIQCIANFLVTMIQVIAIVIQLPFILIANAANECLEDASLCANLLYTLIVAFPYAWVIVFPQYVLFALNNCGALGNFRRRDLQVDESDFDATTTFQQTIIDVMESLKVNDKNDNDDNELVHNFVTNEIKRSLALMVDTLHNGTFLRGFCCVFGWVLSVMFCFWFYLNLRASNTHFSLVES